MGATVSRIRIADFPRVLESDHTMRASRARESSAHQLASHPRARVCPALLLVSYVGQTTDLRCISLAICNARFLASFWRPWRPPRWWFSCCTSYSDPRSRAAITFRTCRPGQRATVLIPSTKITNRIEAPSMTFPRIGTGYRAFCFGAVS